MASELRFEIISDCRPFIFRSTDECSISQSTFAELCE